MRWARWARCRGPDLVGARSPRPVRPWLRAVELHVVVLVLLVVCQPLSCVPAGVADTTATYDESTFVSLVKGNETARLVNYEYNHTDGARVVMMTDPHPAPCPKNHSVVLPRGSKLLFDKRLQTPQGHVYPSDAYFTTPGADRDELRGCACKAGVCFFKCCPFGMEYGNRTPGDKRKACFKAPTAANETSPGTPWGTIMLNLYQVRELDDAAARQDEVVQSEGPLPIATCLTKAGVPPPPHWIVLQNKPAEHMYMLNRPDEGSFLLENGTLFAPNVSNTSYPATEFCLDVYAETGKVSVWLAFQEPVDPERPSNFLFTVYPIGLMISLPFLVATFAVYATIGELRNLHGKSLMCHVSAMILAYVALVPVQLSIVHDGQPILCECLGFLLQFSFLACFFWLNIMCFDIWHTFSGFRAAHGSPTWSSERERYRFLLYSVYAWGGPAAILVVTISLQKLQDSLPDWVIKPKIGNESCYFSTKEAAYYAYFMGPVSVLLLCNVVLFVHTAFRIVHLRRETRALKNAESQRHSDEQQYNVYLKLFLVMGVNWVAEVVSSFHDNPLWIVTDVTNSLQGIFIFIIFVGTGRVRRIVVDRLTHRLAPSSDTSNASTKTTRMVSVRPGPREPMEPPPTPSAAPQPASQQPLQTSRNKWTPTWTWNGPSGTSVQTSSALPPSPTWFRRPRCPTWPWRLSSKPTDGESFTTSD